MPWLYLLIAGVFEMGWPLGFKIAFDSPHKVAGIIVSVVCMACSGLFLFLAQKTISMGTAYAVWAGIGTAGTFIVGILVFKDACTPLRLCSAFLIVAGVAGLRLST